MLKIRQFSMGDELLWVKLRNQIYREYEAWWTDTTVDEMLRSEKSPEFEYASRFFVEISGKSIGILSINIDKLRKEKKGFIRDLGLIPEYSNLEYWGELIKFAAHELAKRGMNTVQGWCRYKSNLANVFEKMDFNLATVESDMEINLTEIQQEIGQNKQAKIRRLQKTSEDDIVLLNSLNNECFKEHFDFRARTIDETRRSLIDTPQRESIVFFVILKNRPVGFIGITIDEKYNLEKKAKSGYIFDIGVLESYRRKGLGSRLILHGLETLAAKGMKQARLDVDDHNPTGAIKLYKKVGFKIIRKWTKYEKTFSNTSEIE